MVGATASLIIACAMLWATVHMDLLARWMD